jgi:hypothetical protein
MRRPQPFLSGAATPHRPKGGKVGGDHRRPCILVAQREQNRERLDQ